jgi:enoyl-CoA hydratase/carnithine racemase
MRTEYETLLVTVDGPIVEVLLNRPAKRNAINFQMVREDLHLADAEIERLRAEGVIGTAPPGSNPRFDL